MVSGAEVKKAGKGDWSSVKGGPAGTGRCAACNEWPLGGAQRIGVGRELTGCWGGTEVRIGDPRQLPGQAL